MTFSSLEFLFGFLPVFVAGYFLVPNLKWRNATLFVGSVLFYAWGEPVFVLLMLASVFANYLIALAMGASEVRGWRRGWLLAGLVLNLSMLFGFKYVDFALSSLAPVLGRTIATPDLPLPLGISFYSFMALAYLIDLYRGRYPVERSPIRLALVIAAFPAVTSGPILRYEQLRDQLDQRTVTLPAFTGGLRRFVVGLAKKVLIANNVAFIATQIFKFPPDQYGAAGAWLGAICWTLQIYFDFSGYSDMAIGLGSMLGFTYPENFNYPYIARSVSDFWRRWHMSLSSFFRDYVYIPLGGNRVSNGRWVLNAGIVWALTGLWHGANWTFVIWGLYYGVLLVLERFLYPRFIKSGPRPLQHAYVLLIVTVGWVLFMSPTIGDAGKVLAAMFGGYGTGSFNTLVLMRVVQPLYLAAFIAAVIGSAPWWRSPRLHLAERPVTAWAFDFVLLAAFAVSVVFVVAKTFNPFIYFRF